jgi:high-affinity iron transporter
MVSAIGANLATGLRDGLEAGLVVSILLAAVRQSGPAGDGSSAARGSAGMRGRGRRGSRPAGTATTPVWLGVLAAVTLAGSSAAVFIHSTGVLAGRAQAAAGGLLSVLTAGVVTAMIFRMRSARTGLTVQSRGGEVTRPAAIPAWALTITAFLAVGREGLPAALLLWTAGRASGPTAGPLTGAIAGLAAAALLCFLLYRWALRLNPAAFFNRAALALIVIAAGVLADGLGQLQAARLLSGQRWIALDLTAHARPGAWWVALVSGSTGLSPRMTVLQVVFWVACLAVVIAAFVQSAGPVPPKLVAPADTAAAGVRRHRSAGARGQGPAGRRERRSERPPWAVAGVLVIVPALAAYGAIAALPASGANSVTRVTVTRTSCAPGWTSASAGNQTFTVDNQSGLPGEINFDDASGDILAEIETIGPATSAQLSATLSSGTYVFKCFMGALPAMASKPVQVTGDAITSAGNAVSRPVRSGPIAVKQVTVRELADPNGQYQAYAAGQLADLAREVSRIEADLHRDDLGAARSDWLSAQLDWERVGASYDSFGTLGLAVDGLPAGLPHGVSDQQFTGLHRLEYGLWHGQSAASLTSVAAKLAVNVALVQRNLTSTDLAGDPASLPIRAHEILEDALRDHLSGTDDEGSGAAFALTYADAQVTSTVLGYLTPLLSAREPGLAEIAGGELADLQQTLLATRVNGQWQSLTEVSLPAREHVDSAIGAALETLATVPDLLEVRAIH